MTKCVRTEEGDTTDEKRKFWSWYFLKNVIFYLKVFFTAGYDFFTIQIINAAFLFGFSKLISSGTEYYAAAFVKGVKGRLEIRTMMMEMKMK